MVWAKVQQSIFQGWVIEQAEAALSDSDMRPSPFFDHLSARPGVDSTSPLTAQLLSLPAVGKPLLVRIAPLI